MDAILYNNTAVDIVLDDLGFTISALDTYEMIGRDQSLVAGSTGLISNISNGSLLLIENESPLAYWSTNAALDILTFGLNKTQLGLGDDTGYLQMAIGNTVARPSSPIGGMTRFNTDSDIVEMYQGSGWHNMPNWGNAIISTDTNGILYAYSSSSGKTLATNTVEADFSTANAHNKTWLQVNDVLVGSGVSFNVAFDATLLLIHAYSGQQGEKSLSLYVDDTEYANIVTWADTDAAGINKINDINIDTDVGHQVRFRAVSPYPGVALGPMVVKLLFAVRKT